MPIKENMAVIGISLGIVISLCVWKYVEMEVTASGARAAEEKREITSSLKGDFISIEDYELIQAADAKGTVIAFDSNSLPRNWSLYTKTNSLSPGIRYYIPQKYDNMPVSKWVKMQDAIVAVSPRIRKLTGKSSASSSSFDSTPRGWLN